MPSPDISPSSPNSANTLIPPDFLAGAALPPQPQQERSRRKRDALLAAAQALFAERGFEAATIEDIAAAAETAVGGFYQHFRTKQQLVLVLMDRLVAELGSFTPALQPDADPQTQIAAVLRAGIELDWQYRGAYRAWREMIGRDPDLRALNRQLETWTTAWIRQLFDALAGLPRARPGIDRAATARLLSTMFWQILAEAEADELDALIDALTPLVYHTLFTDS